MPRPARLVAAMFALLAAAAVVWIIFTNVQTGGSWKGYIVAAVLFYVAVDFGIAAITGGWPTLSFWGG